MTCVEAIEHLKSLRLLKSVYTRLYNDPYKSVYDDGDLLNLIKMTDEEINLLLDSMYNMELEDSYDQNTGIVNKVYKSLTEEKKLLKLCGGPKYEE